VGVGVLVGLRWCCPAPLTLKTRQSTEYKDVTCPLSRWHFGCSWQPVHGSALMQTHSAWWESCPGRVGQGWWCMPNFSSATCSRLHANHTRAYDWVSCTPTTAKVKLLRCHRAASESPSRPLGHPCVASGRWLGSPCHKVQWAHALTASPCGLGRWVACTCNHGM